jgi:hypothetical protein
MKYEQALKVARHKMHVHRANWQVAVLCPTADARDHAFLLTTVILEASSIDVEHINHATHTIVTTHGATITFHVVAGPLDVYMIASTYTHMIVMDGVPSADFEYLHSLLRSDSVHSDELIFQAAVTL